MSGVVMNGAAALAQVSTPATFGWLDLIMDYQLASVEGAAAG